MVRRRTASAVLFLAAGTCTALTATQAKAQTPAPPEQVFGYANFAQQARWDTAFMAVPDATLAGQHLKELTKAPHWASSPEDHATAEYVAAKFRAAGLKTEIVPYKVLLNKPISIQISASDAHGHQLMSGPTPEHVDPKAFGGDPFQNDPRILPAFNGSSGSGDVTADAVYANYGTLEDFNQLQKLGIDVKGKIVLVRYGQNFRGVKAYIAQQRGAAGVIIFSDPYDDGYDRGDKYPRGPYRPDSAVQRGSVQFLPLYPGDPETPGIASTPDLPDSKRVLDPAKMNQPSIPVNPLSYKDAAPILEALEGPNVPHDWQGGLPFAYHLGGSGAVKVHMDLKQDYALRTIWDVVGTIEPDPASHEDPNAWVVAGNHRDAWVYGAVDPNSGTAAMLETAHGLGDLLKQGWKPKRRIVLCSWDAEEEGLMGSTEWAEQHADTLAHAVAYFNTDVAVSGTDFNASAVPSLKGFVRDATREVPSPKGGSVYDQWQKAQSQNPRRRGTAANPFSAPSNSTTATTDVRVGDLGSGSDYTPFIQHLGVPSTDIGSDGPYGVYHSVFDNYNWFIRNADPTFVYEQQMARVFGLEILHMADTDVLPYDYRAYAREILDYLTAAQKRAASEHVNATFDAALKAAARFQAAGDRIYSTQSALATQNSTATPAQLQALNVSLRDAETALLNEAGLPKRPWFKHTIYAPGEYTGYAAVVIPGVNEGIDAADSPRTQSQLEALTTALNHSAEVLEKAAK
jgi:N-acetylated-alpha-linked acidic dipeptidase